MAGLSVGGPARSRRPLFAEDLACWLIDHVRPRHGEPSKDRGLAGPRRPGEDVESGRGLRASTTAVAEARNRPASPAHERRAVTETALLALRGACDTSRCPFWSAAGTPFPARTA